MEGTEVYSKGPEVEDASFVPCKVFGARYTWHTKRS